MSVYKSSSKSSFIKSKTIYIIFLTISLCLTHHNSVAQNYYINHEHITTKQGLSNNFINDITQDKVGFIWIATQDGLNRYDGYNFETFRVDSDKPDGLPNNKINRLLEDKKGNIWITTGQGLAKWNIASEKIQQIPFFKNKGTHAIYIDSKNTVWTNSENFIYAMDSKGDISEFRINDFAEKKLRIDKIWEQTIYNKKELLAKAFIAKLGLYFLYIFDKKNKKWKRLLYSKFNIFHLSNEGKCFLFPVLGQVESDLRKNPTIYEPNIIKNYKIMKVPDKIQGHNDKQKIDLDKYPNKLEWIEYIARMLAIDWKEEKIISQDIYADIPDLSHTYKRFVDNSGSIWLITSGFGIFILPKYVHYNFKAYTSTQSKNVLSGIGVRAIYQDENDNVWIGTQINKIDIFSPDGKHSILQTKGSSTKKIVRGKEANILWISEDGTFIKVDKQTQKIIKRYESEDFINTMFVLDKENILLAGSNLLTVFNPKTEKLKKYNHIKDISCFAKGSDNKLWIGSYNNGLGLLDFESMKVQYFPYQKSEKTIFSKHIKYIHEDTKGRLWVATTLGLNLFDKKTKTFTNFNTKDGLPNNMVYTILEDNTGHLWLSTNKGISKFNPDTKKFINFDASYGLQDDEFNTYSSFKNERTGEMFFGGIGGLNSFYPEQMKKNKFIPPLVLTAFKRKGKVVDLGKPLREVKQIEMEYNEAQTLSFEFVALSFFQSKRNQYAYKVDELHQEWINLGTKHELSFNNLNAGTYTLRIKGSNNAGVWNDKGLTITIIVNPPFWQTWWFRISLVLGIILLVAIFYTIRIKRIKKQKRNLEIIVEQRTKALREEHKKAIEKGQMLRKTNQKLIELGEFKEVLMNGIVHDLKNPLNVLLNKAEEFIDENKRKVIQQTSLGMLNMVLNILDVQKFEETEVKLNIQEINMLDILKEAQSQVEFLLREKFLSIHSNIPENIWLEVDSNLVIRVLVNLLSNAIKYSPNNAKIEVIAERILGIKQVKVSIIDNGEGIQPEQITEVFKKFKHFGSDKNNTNNSTGLGLTFCKMAIEAHGGTITVSSVPNEKTTFSFTLPLSLNPDLPNTVQEENKISALDASLHLSESEKKVLSDYVQDLRSKEVYEISEIRAILFKIDFTQSDNLQQWYSNMENALYNCNEQIYQELIEAIS